MSTYFLLNFGVFEWLYPVQKMGPINTKFENVANLNVLFLTMWIFVLFIAL